MPRPYELDPAALERHLEEMVDVTFEDLQSQFLVLPKGSGFIDYSHFQDAYEVLKRNTSAFTAFAPSTVWAALEEDSLAFVVLRTILGMSPPEWAELANSERGSDVTQGAARSYDTRVRENRTYLAKVKAAKDKTTFHRVNAMVEVRACT